MDRLRRLNSDVTITGERSTVTSRADIDAVIEGCDVFVLCADQPGEIRAWANAACLASGTPWVDAGYHGPSVTAAAYVPGCGPRYECCWLTDHETHDAVVGERAYSVRRGGPNAVNATSAGLSGHLAAHLTIALVTGAPAVTPGRLMGVNLAAGSDPDVTYSRHPSCPACGDRT